MGNVTVLKQRKVNTLWAPTKKTKANWRFGATPAVLDFKNIRAVKAAAEREEDNNRAREQAQRDVEWERKRVIFSAMREDLNSDLNKLVGELNEMVRGSNDHYPDMCTDSISDCMASTVAEVLRNSYELDQGCLDWIERAQHKGWTDLQIIETLVSASEISIGGMYREDNEIACMQCWSDQIDFEAPTIAAINGLSEIAREYLDRYVGGSIDNNGRHMEVSHDDVYIRLILDHTQLPKRIKKSKGGLIMRKVTPSRYGA